MFSSGQRGFESVIIIMGGTLHATTGHGLSGVTCLQVLAMFKNIDEVGEMRSNMMDNGGRQQATKDAWQTATNDFSSAFLPLLH